MFGLLGLVAVLTFALQVEASPSSSDAAKDIPPQAMELLETALSLGGEGWTAGVVEAESSSLLLRYTHRQTGRGLVVKVETRNDARSSFGRSEHFQIHYLQEGDAGLLPSKDVTALMERLLSWLAKADPGLHALQRNGLLFPEARRSLAEQTASKENETPPSNPYLQVETTIAGGFLVLALLAIPLLFSPLRSAWRESPASLRWAGLAVFLLGVAMRFLLPERMVMAYSGYGLIEQALDGVHVGKYGAGTPLVYHLFLRFTPGWGEGYLWLNRTLGSATVLLAALFALRSQRNPRLGFLVLTLLSLHPMLVSDHRSESNLVPTLFFFFAGLNLALVAKESGNVTAWLGAWAGLVFSVFCRPMFLLFVPCSLVLLGVVSPGNLPGLKARWAGLSVWKKGLIVWLFLVTVATLVAHVVYLGEAFRQDRLVGYAPSLSVILREMFLGTFSLRNLFFDPWATPVVLPLLWLPALWCGLRALGSSTPDCRGIFSFGAAAFFFLLVSVYFLDAPAESLPRLQIPALYIGVLLSASGLVILWREAEKRGVAIWMTAPLAVLGMVSFLPSAYTFTRMDNEGEEHRMLLDVATVLPESFDLAMLRENDEPKTWGVFRNYPDFLFRPPRMDGRLFGLSAMLDRRSGVTGEGKESFVYLGMRCHAVVTAKEEVQRPGSRLDDAGLSHYEHPLCKQWRDTKRLVPVLERRVPNRVFPGRYLRYPAGDTLLLGLYRVEGN